MALDFPLVDAHVHLWDLQGPIRYPWLIPPFSDGGVAGNVGAIATTYLLDDYLADAQGFNIGKMVHVDAGAEPADALAETQWLQALGDSRGLPSAIVAYAPLNHPDAAALLEAHAAHSRVRGIRQILNWHADPNLTYAAADLLEDPAFEAGYALLGHYGLRFDSQIYPGQMPAAAALAGRHPETAMILNHCGMPVDASAEGMAQWREGMQTLARRPKVAVKISGLSLVRHDWTVESLRPLVLETIDIFGVDRCMFASDFPADKLFGTFSDFLGAYDHITGDFSDDERRKLFASNAERIYGV
jgi:predicted TIM-barrel fold metal-dependent hydrolase